MKESDLQGQVAQLLDEQGLLWFHPPNGAYYGGGRRSAIVGAIVKKQGVKSGVPDCVILTPSPTTGKALFIELKVGRNKLSPDQEVWKELLIEWGYGHAVARSLDEVKQVLNEYGHMV